MTKSRKGFKPKTNPKKIGAIEREKREDAKFKALCQPTDVEIANYCLEELEAELDRLSDQGECFEKNKDALSFRQDRFIDNYIDHNDSYQAAIDAGYGEWSAQNASQMLLRNEKIQKEIKRRRLLLKQRLRLSKERVLEAYNKIAFCDVQRAFDLDGNLLPISKMPKEVAFALQGCDITEIYEGRGEAKEKVTKIKPRFHNKKEALDALSKHLGLFEADKKVIHELGIQGILQAMPEDVREMAKDMMLKRLAAKKKK